MDRNEPRARAARSLLARLDEVRERGDRRASGALLDLLLHDDLDDERRADVAETLRALEDPRTAQGLREAVHDAGLQPGLRAISLEVLAGIPVDAPSREESLRCARSPDFVLRAFGVRALDVQDGDVLAAAANDPSPLVRYSAVDAIASIARTPPLVEATRRALADPDAAIREAACRVALFDEPLDATHELLAALADESVAVRTAASDALEDYPRVSVILALGEARGESEDGLAAQFAFEGIAQRVRAALARSRPRVRRRLERWAEPVRWLLDARDGTELVDALADDECEGYEAVDVAEAEAVLLDPDQPASRQRRTLVFRSWRKAGPAGLALLRECARSPSWAIRQGAAHAFGDLRAAGDLVGLAQDREPVVRRAAFEELRELREPRGLAAAWETLADAAMRPTAGDDALGLVVERAPREEAERAVLAELDRPDDRDGLWLGAIGFARAGRMAAAVPSLARIARAPVAASVLQHVAALAALRALGVRRGEIDLAHLEPLDHLDVQRELAEWDWHGSRYG